MISLYEMSYVLELWKLQVFQEFYIFTDIFTLLTGTAIKKQKNVLKIDNR